MHPELGDVVTPSSYPSRHAPCVAHQSSGLLHPRLDQFRRIDRSDCSAFLC
uniref:Uncharacterized protein n=1 Tax=Arundo donax TaxID=35708 RepID=A0A0A9HJ93_ARUDO